MEEMSSIVLPATPHTHTQAYMYMLFHIDSQARLTLKLYILVKAI